MLRWNHPSANPPQSQGSPFLPKNICPRHTPRSLSVVEAAKETPGAAKLCGLHTGANHCLRRPLQSAVCRLCMAAVAPCPVSALWILCFEMKLSRTHTCHHSNVVPSAALYLYYSVTALASVPEYVVVVQFVINILVKWLVWNCVRHPAQLSEASEKHGPSWMKGQQPLCLLGLEVECGVDLLWVIHLSQSLTTCWPPEHQDRWGTENRNTLQCSRSWSTVSLPSSLSVILHHCCIEFTWKSLINISVRGLV